MSPPRPLYLLLLVLVLVLVVSVAFADDDVPSSSNSSCGGGDRCGDIVLPFPFHLNSSSSSSSCTGNDSSVFRLSCGDGHNDSTLVLRLGAAAFRVLGFVPSGSLLLDYAYPPPAAAAAASTTLCDPAYAALSRSTSPAAALDGAATFLAVTPANILRLYACEDSSLCRAGCDDVAASCDGGRSASGCCYPLSDGSVWKPGDGLAVFAGFGCRGFSSCVKNRTSSSPAPAVMRGIEVEWAVPRGSALAECADGAVPVNASAVRGGVRCACALGLVGDGFALGTGCSKATCSSDGGGQAGEADGGECCHGRFCSKKAVALAGFFVSVFFLAAAMSFWLFLRQPSDNVGRPWDLDPACIPKILDSVCNARQFTYEQLEAATKRFEDGDGDGEKPVVGAEVHAGVLDDGTVVAVQRIGYETPEKLRLVLDRVERLPEVSHRNIARVVGFCLDDPGGHAMLLVHEHFAGGTLEDHLRQVARGGRRRAVVLSWYHRVNIAIELATALTYLLHVHDDAPSSFLLHDLRSSDIFLDSDLTAKIAGYKLVAAAETTNTTYYQYQYNHHHHHHHAAAEEQDVVRNYGHLLIELLTGLRHQHPLDTVAPKVREGRLHEVLDPTLLLQQAPSSSSSSGKKLPASAEEVRKVLEVAVRCLEVHGSGAGAVGMGDVARELMHVLRDNMGSSSKIEISLEETFSSSSLLQMISMSPDTLQRHLP